MGMAFINWSIPDFFADLVTHHLNLSSNGYAWKHLQLRDERMDSRGAGRPDSEIFRCGSLEV
jgi:hypothetical protein